MISITKKIEFETAHRLSDYNGPCREIHGHTYKLEMTISGPVQEETDMVLDFKILKKILKSAVLNHLDHALILKDNPENHRILENYSGKITWMSTEPSVERMLLFLADAISRLLPQPTCLESLQLYETSNSYATWKK